MIVSNETYNNGIIVPYAINDGRILRLYFINTLGIPETNIKLYENATLNDIKKSITWLKQVLTAFDNDVRIIIYYIGQGFSDGEEKLLYLMPIDYTGQNAIEQFISLSDIKKEIGDNAKLGSILICDANFNGKDRSDNNLEGTRGVAIKIRKDEHHGLNNFVTFLSSQEEETSFAYKGYRHGLFTYELLKVLKDSAGELSLGDIFERISKNVQETSIKEFNKKQQPKYISTNKNLWKSWKLK